MAELHVMKGVPFTVKRLEQWLKEDGFVIVQPKRDEIRCIVKIDNTGPTWTVEYTSAQGKPLYNLAQFDNMWIRYANEFGVFHIDCGIMVNESFDYTKRIVKSKNKQYELMGREQQEIIDGKGKKAKVIYSGKLRANFWLYDLPSMDAGYEYRRNRMYKMHLFFESGHLHCPATTRCRSVAAVEEMYEEYIAAGHEGAMVKRNQYDYKVGRTVDWMKMKPDAEVDAQVTGFNPGKDGFEGMVGSIELVDVQGQRLSISGFPMELRKELTANPQKYIGRIVEVKYMQRDSAGGYRHPRFFRWHSDKEILD